MQEEHATTSRVDADSTLDIDARKNDVATTEVTTTEVTTTEVTTSEVTTTAAVADEHAYSDSSDDVSTTSSSDVAQSSAMTTPEANNNNNGDKMAPPALINGVVDDGGDGNVTTADVTSPTEQQALVANNIINGDADVVCNGDVINGNVSTPESIAATTATTNSIVANGDGSRETDVDNANGDHVGNSANCISNNVTTPAPLPQRTKRAPRSTANRKPLHADDADAADDLPPAATSSQVPQIQINGDVTAQHNDVNSQ